MRSKDTVCQSDRLAGASRKRPHHMPTPSSRLVRTATALLAAALAAATALAPMSTTSAAGLATVDGRDAGGGVRAAGSVLELDVTGRGGSASDAAAVSLNLTATETGGAGFATVYPCGSSRPEASTITIASGAASTRARNFWWSRRRSPTSRPITAAPSVRRGKRCCMATVPRRLRLAATR